MCFLVLFRVCKRCIFRAEDEEVDEAEGEVRELVRGIEMHPGAGPVHSSPFALIQVMNHHGLHPHLSLSDRG